MRIKEDVPCQINYGDTAWVMTAGILVLGMIPSLAFFEGGLLRRKNFMSVLTQVYAGLCILSIMWFCFGFSLTFGDDLVGGIIGNFNNVFFLGVSINECEPSLSTNIPHGAFAFFQMMFAVIAPLLMTGALAERFRMKPFLIFIALWSVLVYYPVAHWIWSAQGWLTRFDVLDFAGGIVIHTTSASSSLVIALLMGKRKGFDKHHGEVTPHNIPFAALGTALLWIGWFGFNAGSALASGGTAVSAVICTQVASSASAVVWMTLGWVHHRKISLNGAVAGLAGITPASGYISMQAALIVGFVIGVGSYAAILFFKHLLKIDDSLDVTSVHGVTSIIGTLSIGFFGSKAVNPQGQDGVIYGHPIQLAYQLLGIAVALVWSVTVTFVLILLLRRWAKPTPEEEEEGMDKEINEDTPYVFDEPIEQKEGYENLEEEVTALVDESTTATSVNK